MAEDAAVAMSAGGSPPGTPQWSPSFTLEELEQYSPARQSRSDEVDDPPSTQPDSTTQPVQGNGLAQRTPQRVTDLDTVKGSPRTLRCIRKVSKVKVDSTSMCCRLLHWLAQKQQNAHLVASPGLPRKVKFDGFEHSPNRSSVFISDDIFEHSPNPSRLSTPDKTFDHSPDWNFFTPDKTLQTPSSSIDTDTQVFVDVAPPSAGSGACSADRVLPTPWPAATPSSVAPDVENLELDLNEYTWTEPMPTQILHPTHLGRPCRHLVHDRGGCGVATTDRGVRNSGTLTVLSACNESNRGSACIGSTAAVAGPPAPARGPLGDSNGRSYNSAVGAVCSRSSSYQSHDPAHEPNQGSACIGPTAAVARPPASARSPLVDLNGRSYASAVGAKRSNPPSILRRRSTNLLFPAQSEGASRRESDGPSNRLPLAPWSPPSTQFFTPPHSRLPHGVQGVSSHPPAMSSASTNRALCDNFLKRTGMGDHPILKKYVLEESKSADRQTLENLAKGLCPLWRNVVDNLDKENVEPVAGALRRISAQQLHDAAGKLQADEIATGRSLSSPHIRRHHFQKWIVAHHSNEIITPAPIPSLTL